MRGQRHLRRRSVSVPGPRGASPVRDPPLTRAPSDPYVWVAAGVVHVIFHDEQITRCADSPVGCWPGGRHAWSTDGGSTFTVSPLDAYNGTISWDDGSVEEVYLRARPHLIVDQDTGRVTHLSNGESASRHRTPQAARLTAPAPFRHQAETGVRLGVHTGRASGRVMN